MSSRSQTTEGSTVADTSELATGRAIERVEDGRILTGRAEYVHDVTPDDCLHMAFVRSSHAHAHIEDVDTSDAEGHPDCELVLTAADLEGNVSPMPCGLNGMHEWPLADGKVRYAGEPIAAVFATDRYQAEDIVEEISVTYDRLDATTDTMDAREDRTILHEDVGTNVPHSEDLTFGEPERAFEEADHVIEGTYSWGRISGVPLETAGVVAEYSPDSDSFEIVCNLQAHTLTNDTIAESLGYPDDRVNVRVPPDVGGSFGTKIRIHRYCILAALGSKRAKRPVKYVEDRMEELQGGDSHSTEREYEARIALDDGGRILGLDIWFADNFGAFPRYPVTQTLKPLAIVSGPYDIRNVEYEYEVVLSNKASQTAYRGFGTPAHCFVVEMLVDEAARTLGFDPYELRRKNLIGPDQMPYKLPTKNVYDSGDYPEAMDRLRQTVEEEFEPGGLLHPKTVTEKREEDKYRGCQLSLVLEPGVSGWDWTDRPRVDLDEVEDRATEDLNELPEHFRLTVSEDGSVTALMATDSAGQGHETIIGQMLADELSLAMANIEVDYLDSRDAPTEYGQGASRLAVMLSGATRGAAARLVDTLERIATDHWDCDLTDVSYDSGGVEHVDGRQLRLEELVALHPDDALSVSYDYEHPAVDHEIFDEAFAGKLPVYPTASFAVNAPIVEVDANSGEIELLKFYTLRDCGTMINPMIVEGQAHGGIAQGIGAALLEEFRYDDETGQPQSVTLFDYILPSIDNVPPIEMEHSETPSPFTEIGAKGVGEGGIIDAPASIAASINDALEPLDVNVDRIPCTPAYVHRLLQDRP